MNPLQPKFSLYLDASLVAMLRKLTKNELIQVLGDRAMVAAGWNDESAAAVLSDWVLESLPARAATAKGTTK